ncbi:unnamed protein product (mitochondrion) [Plasmodiophora brassicae]|uniref:Kinesin-like protein n=1 Tax=Plasmodiophora brassicae TaxID=37360 RepID=A0A3P3Y2B8_PLABS|nr:unnamed protein product [Plasmodiophora brassicae]
MAPIPVWVDDDVSGNARDECVHVCIRVRPSSAPGSCVRVRHGQEIQLLGDGIALPGSPVHGESAPLVENEKHLFTFDSVLDEATTQEEVYERTCRSIIDKFFDGYNTSVLVYGQTGSGKTFTVTGAGRDRHPGIAYRAAQHVEQWLTRPDASQFETVVLVSLMEIYNDTLIDLLLESPTMAKDKDAAGKLRIREDPVLGVFVNGLTRVPVETSSDIVALIEKGSTRRHIAATSMNEFSSRSHSVLTITIHQRHLDDEEGFQAKRSELNIVDLAGSERQSATKATGHRLREGAKINASLSALGLVIKNLVEGSTHVPFRNSALTRLLQNSLGGNARTLLIACISPTASCVSESLSTLRFAARAKLIQNRPRVYADPKMARIAQLESELALARSQLEACRCRDDAPYRVAPAGDACCTIM